MRLSIRLRKCFRHSRSRTNGQYLKKPKAKRVPTWRRICPGCSLFYIWFFRQLWSAVGRKHHHWPFIVVLGYYDECESLVKSLDYYSIYREELSIDVVPRTSTYAITQSLSKMSIGWSSSIFTHIVTVYQICLLFHKVGSRDYVLQLRKLFDIYLFYPPRSWSRPYEMETQFSK